MIFQAINIIRTELNSGGVLTAELGNIVEILSSENNNGTNADIIISLINIEENRISRDPLNYQKKNEDIFFKNPAVHLNLTLLFTSFKNQAGYGLALQNIQDLILFFQHKYVFDHSNTGGLDSGIEKLILEMVSLSFEQLNQLWSILGGKYQPSVIYRMRMVTIDSVTDFKGSVIKEIETHHSLK
jgi:hypothetical protein